MANQKPVRKKPNRYWVLWGIVLIFTGLRLCQREEGPLKPEPKPIIPELIQEEPKTYDKEDWKGYDDDSLRELYDPNHPDYDYDPNDPNRGEWSGYYE